MQRFNLRPLYLPLVAVGAIVIIALDISGYLGAVNGLIHVLLKPPAVFFTEGAGLIESTMGSVQRLRTLHKRNLQLESDVNRLTVENLRLSEVEIENQQLRTLLEFARANPAYDYRGGQITARVIGDGATLFTHPIQIDIGEKQGLRQGMPVITDRGLVGRIFHVYPHSSDIILITDPSSSVNVMTQTSRASGILTGSVDGLPKMTLIPLDIEISVGEIVITSGFGGHFPKGLVAGQVVKVINNDNMMFQTAVIQPTVDFDRVELVLVITNFSPFLPDSASP